MTSDDLCHRTEAVLRAAREGGEGLPSELATHARFCPACAEALLLESLLAREAARGGAEARGRLPDPGTLWRRARSEAEADALTRALRPIAVCRKIAWAVGAGLAVLALGRFGPELVAWIGRLDLSWSLPAANEVSPEALLLTGAALGLFGLLTGLYASWAEEV